MPGDLGCHNVCSGEVLAGSIRMRLIALCAVTCEGRIRSLFCVTKTHKNLDLDQVETSFSGYP
jgi:hypothetical protein